MLPVHKDRDPHLRLQLANPSTGTITIRKGCAVAFGKAVDLDNVAAFVGMGDDDPASAPESLANMTSAQSAAPANTTGPTFTKRAAADIEKRWQACEAVKDIDLSNTHEVSADIILDLKRRILEEAYLFVQGEKTRPSDAVECVMKLAPGTPIFFRRSRTMSPPQAKQLDELTQQQLSKGVIEPSESPYSSPVLMVPKSGGRLRFVVDLRALK